MMPDARVAALEKAAKFLKNNDDNEAQKVILEEYPFVPIVRKERSYTVQEMAEQFFRDGFIDRYSGERLINPGMLRVLSCRFPDAFPYHPHWKTDECHKAYWDYQPTIDHIVPVALGGADSPENWATTSMRNNSAKSNFTLEQLHWTLKDKGSIREWDGLSGDFIYIVESDASLLGVKKIREWYRATKAAYDNL
ncbi:MAG: HNH endonuclease [Lachnospiraceae bacterium]|nr:HNH endonuclease [Lachnospiraceae bacterium]